MASLEAGDLKGKRIGSQWRITRAAVDSFLDVAEPAPHPRAPIVSRNRRAVEVRLPRLRRRGALESGQAEARLPVLRHRVAGDSSTRRGADRRSTTSCRRCAAIGDDRARLAGRQASGQVPELPGDLGVRPASVRRRAASSAGRRSSSPTRRSKHAFRPESAAAVQGQRAAGARAHPRPGTASCGSRPTRSSARRSPTRSAASTCPTGPSTRSVDARVDGRGGHTYYTTETYAQNGQTRTRQVRQVRWEPAAGRLQHFFDDDLVCASVGVHPALLRGVEPFPTGELEPYDAGYVAGWIVERYQIDLVAAAQRAREAMDRKVEALCARADPGRHATATSACAPTTRPDVQAHPGAGVAAVVHLRARRPTSA